MNYMKKALTYGMIIGLAVMNAVAHELFVVPNDFAPSGINGICTMIQYVFGISIGYLSLIINIPLAYLVYKKISRSLAIRSLLYVMAFSMTILVLEKVDLSRFQYDTDISAILGPLVAGILTGATYAFLMKASSYTGGTDYVASLIQKKYPEKNLYWLIFGINVVVAVASYFVYDFQIEPVLLCILFSFMSSTVSDRMTKSDRSAIRFEIITEQPEKLAADLIETVKHGVTKVPGRGMYRGRDVSVLICVVNRSQVNAVTELLRRYPDSFTIMSHVNEVVGSFMRLDAQGRPAVDLLDQGDGFTL